MSNAEDLLATALDAKLIHDAIIKLTPIKEWRKKNKMLNEHNGYPKYASPQQKARLK